LVTSLVLTLLRDEGHFHLETDASRVATGAALSQQQEDSMYHPVGYASKSLTSMERNYTMYDKELLTIMRALEDWRNLLLGAREPFDIFTNHCNLVYFQDLQKLTSRQANWSMKLQDYDFHINHMDSTSNGRADALSRPDIDEGSDMKKEVTTLPERLFICALSATDQEETGCPDDKQIAKLIRVQHDLLTAGHLGV
jgi:hypothetical protein